MDQGSTGSSTITQLTTSSVSAVEQNPAYLSDASINGAGYISDDDDEEEVPVYESQEDPEEEEDPSEDEDPEEEDPSEDEDPDADPINVEEDPVYDAAPLRQAAPSTHDGPVYPPEIPDGPTQWVDMWLRDGRQIMMDPLGPMIPPPESIIRPSDGSGPSYLVVMDDEGRRGIQTLEAGPSAPPPEQPTSPQRESGVGWLIETDDEEQMPPRDRAGPSTVPSTHQRPFMENAQVIPRYSWENLMEQDRIQRRRIEPSIDLPGPSRLPGASQQSIDAPGPSHSSAVIGFLASDQTPPTGVISETYERLMLRLSFLARHIQSFGRQEASVYLRYLDDVIHLYRSGLHDDVEERHWVSAFTCLLPHTSAWRQHLVDPEYAELRAVGIEGWISSCRVFARSQTPRP